ncbi:MAG: CDP-diacylglycerol--serine O-phosphatidyltransferase [Candidatus Omnitrophica bacterium]|nr:CDP-diacylglycerol--serine O-phosphatidyltransferase [Candidatus Omnitrophota bacterium]
MESARYMANVITAGNLLFGSMSIFLSLMGSYVPAAWIIFFAIVFDIADGKIARLTEGSSQFGIQFDSLADLISFVVAPAVLIFTVNRDPFFLWRLLVCLVAIFCGAFRLARFNTEAEDKIAVFFNGLPTPAFGAALTSFVLIWHRYHLHIQPRIISVITAILAMMMVSRIKYPTLKNISLLQGKYLLVLLASLILLLIFPEITVVLFTFSYVFLVPIFMKGVAK